MSAADHIPTPCQEDYKHPYYVRCSCGWRSAKYMPGKTMKSTVAWKEFRTHWSNAVVSDFVAGPQVDVMEEIPMFDPSLYS